MSSCVPFAGTERKMIGVAQYHFCAGLLELSDFDSFDGAEGADGHKRGQFDGAVSRLESPSPCTAVVVLVNECVHGNVELSRSTGGIVLFAQLGFSQKVLTGQKQKNVLRVFLFQSRCPRVFDAGK